MVKCKEVSCCEDSCAYGLCKKHYNERSYQFKKKTPCIIEGCERGQKCKGLCSRHYRKMRKCSKCSGTVFRNDLCKKHYALECSQCSFPGCEEKEIFCASKMLCNKHYKQSNRPRKRKNVADTSNVSTPIGSDNYEEFGYMDFLTT